MSVQGADYMGGPEEDYILAQVVDYIQAQTGVCMSVLEGASITVREAVCIRGLAQNRIEATYRLGLCSLTIWSNMECRIWLTLSDLTCLSCERLPRQYTDASIELKRLL